MNKKRIVSLGLATSIMLSSAAAFADIGDIYKKPDYTKVYYEAVDVMKDEDVQLELMKNPEKYAFEGKDRKAYDYVDANKEFVKDNDGFVDNLSEDYDGVDLEEDQELVVESVSAITQTVFGDQDDSVVKFQINGDKEVTAEDLVKEGYTVNFASDKKVFDGEVTTSTTGKIKKDITVESFKYSVEVVKGEDKIKSPATAEVKVIKSTTLKSIDELELQDGTEKVESNTLHQGQEGYKVVVTKATTVKGEEASDLGTGFKFESSDKKVALVKADGTVNPVSVGTTTITVSKDGVSKDIKITVAKDAPEVTKLEADVKSVDIVEGGEQTITITAFDQYGDKINNRTLTYTSANEEIATIGANDGKVTGVAKGSTTVTIKDGKASITIPVTVGENKLADYKLEVKKVDGQSDDTTIDVYDEKDNKVTLVFNGYNAEGQLVGPQELKTTIDEEGYSYEIVNEDEAVTVTNGTAGEITLVAKEAGKATVKIYDGALLVDELTVEITVNDSTPTVEKAIFEKDLKITKAEDTTVLKIDGVKFTGKVEGAKFVDEFGAIEITNEKDNGNKIVFGTIELVSDIDGAKLSIKGEKELQVSGLTAGAAGAITIKVLDKAGEDVHIEVIDVNIPAKAE